MKSVFLEEMDSLKDLFNLTRTEYIKGKNLVTCDAPVLLVIHGPRGREMAETDTILAAGNMIMIAESLGYPKYEYYWYLNKKSK